MVYTSKVVLLDTLCISKYTLEVIIDKILENTLLFDYYGALLTEKQYSTYEMYFSEDLTLQEIANIQETTKQAVSDLLKRTSKNLKDIEDKLKLVEKHESIREELNNLFEIIDNSEFKKEAKLDSKIDKIKETLIDLL